jgi:hypothetical protein
MTTTAMNKTMVTTLKVNSFSIVSLSGGRQRLLWLLGRRSLEGQANLRSNEITGFSPVSVLMLLPANA